jgi:hypothetical protein
MDDNRPRYSIGAISFKYGTVATAENADATPTINRPQNRAGVLNARVRTKEPAR